MNKIKNYAITTTILITAFLMIKFLFASTFFKTYEDRPALSPAPLPYTTQWVNHFEASYCIGPDKFSDSYYVDKPVNEIETYYLQEMNEYCRFGTDVLFTPCKRNTTATYSCLSASCTLKSKHWNVNELFSVEILEFSATKVLVQQTHLVSYSRTEKCNLPPGE